MIEGSPAQTDPASLALVISTRPSPMSAGHT
jgi:hypothetical protein